LSCNNCGYTEVYNLQALEGKDDLGTFLEILFAGSRHLSRKDANRIRRPA
jgi:hypothetical protein